MDLFEKDRFSDADACLLFLITDTMSDIDSSFSHVTEHHGCQISQIEFNWIEIYMYISIMFYEFAIFLQPTHEFYLIQFLSIPLHYNVTFIHKYYCYCYIHIWLR